MPHEANDPTDRRHPRLPLDLEALAFFLNGRKVEHAEAITGGATNTNHKLRLSDGSTVVARRYARGHPQIDAHAMRLGRQAVPVPDLLWSDANTAVFTFVDGHHLTNNANQLRSAGKAIATMTAIRFDTVGQIQADGRAKPFEWGTPSGWFAQTLDYPQTKHWLGEERLRALQKLAEQHDLFSVDPKIGPCLVHGDFRPDNLLVKNHRVVAVLDWEFAHAGSWFMDLGNLLRHFDPTAEKPVLEGLREGGLAVPEDAVDRAKLIDLSSHLEFLTSARSDAFKATRIELIDRTLQRFA